MESITIIQTCNNCRSANIDEQGNVTTCKHNNYIIDQPMMINQCHLFLEKAKRSPVNFEDCVAHLRLEDCKYCTGKILGTNWKHCKTRVNLYIHEGGYIQN